MLVHNRRMITLTLAALLGSGLLTTACSTPEKKAPTESKESEPIETKGKEETSGEQASSSRVTVTNSLANNPLTSQTIATAKASSELARFQAGKGELALQGVISTQRLARKSAGEVLGTAKKLSELQMEKGASRTLSPEVRLEIALAALQSHNFALAEYYLQELTDAKAAHVKAGAYNALGVVALRDDRVPEAVLYFKEALKAVSTYKPALLNLGFAALRGGDLVTAKQNLAKIENDWFVQYAMISIDRMEGDVGGAVESCDRVLKKEPDHIAALFNCGLVEFQNKHNYARAKEYLTKAGKAKYGEPSWGEKAFMMISQMETDEAQAKMAEARAKAEKAAAEKAKAKPAAGAPGAGAGGAGGGAAPAATPAAGDGGGAAQQGGD